MRPRDRANVEDGRYEDFGEHFRDEISLTRLLLSRAIARLRPGALPRDAIEKPDLDPAIAALVRSIVKRLSITRSLGTPMPLDRIRAVFGLSGSELRVLAFLTVLELQPELRELARFATGDPTRAEPDVGLIQTVLYDDAAPRVITDLRPDGALFRFALLVDVDEGRESAYVLRRLRVTERVLELAHGFDRLDRKVAGTIELMQAAPVLAPLQGQDQAADSVRHLLAAAVTASSEGRTHPVVCVAGHQGAGRKTLICSGAAILDRQVLRVSCERLPKESAALAAMGRAIIREAIWWRAIVLLENADSYGEGSPAQHLDRLLFASIPAPVAATCGTDDKRPAQFDRGAVSVQIALANEADRSTMWRFCLGESATPDLIEWSAERYTLTPGRILSASRAALASATAREAEVGSGRVSCTRDDIHGGVRSVLDGGLSILATRMTWRQSWADLVLPPDTLLEVRELISRVAHRRRVHDDWGFAGKVGKGLGITALFTGPPGTGKTMVAGLIASELALDLYQVDLSRIVSKWVGETEKNLAALFDAAEVGHAILLFDEADSLFAKRTEVSSSVDRYANLEVNYLLQRMEAFRGISILTTNHDTAIDDAFRRRLSCRIEFSIPEADERLRLWRSLLTPESTGNAILDVRRLADKYVMSGGYIRNAVLRAAFLAADQGGHISMHHLVHGANVEYAGFGKVMA